MSYSSASLKRTLGPLSVWGLGVGYVISGMYFGWNLGLPEGGPYGMLVATIFVTVMYVCFVLSYSELAAAIPRAGGAFVYAHRALGPMPGFIAGAAQGIEFVFAPPAIAAAIGAYISIFFPDGSPIFIAMAAYILFTGLNIYGVQQSAIFGIIITILAVLELLLFVGLTLPHFEWVQFQKNPLPNGWFGAFAAIPYAIWFYLAIEGVANIAEEVKNPQRDLFIGFNLAMATLVLLALAVFFSGVGIAGWESIVYPAGSTSPSDSPLPLALAKVTGESHVMYHLLVSIGLLGLLASFHGIIMVAGRTTMEFGRVGYAPQFIGKVLQKRQTPAFALIVNMGIGFCALLTGKTSEIITLAVFGAITLYIVSMISVFKLRKVEPELERPFKAPLYPFIPMIALSIAIICLLALIYFNFILFLIYGFLLLIGSIWFKFFVSGEAKTALNLNSNV